MRRRLGKKRLRQIAGGYSAVHDVETLRREQLEAMTAARDRLANIADNLMQELKASAANLGDDEELDEEIAPTSNDIAELRKVGAR